MKTVGALSIALAVLAVPAPLCAQDIATIQKLEDKLADAMNRGDAAAMANMYTDDAYLMPANAEPVRGRENIKAFWEKGVQLGTDLKITVTDVKAAGTDTAIEVAKFSRKLKTDPPREVEGKILIVWKKVGNDWKIFADSFGPNKPPGGGGRI
mgnify:CR=1 FL=1